MPIEKHSGVTDSIDSNYVNPQVSRTNVVMYNMENWKNKDWLEMCHNDRAVPTNYHFPRKKWMSHPPGPFEPFNPFDPLNPTRRRPVPQRPF